MTHTISVITTRSPNPTRQQVAASIAAQIRDQLPDEAIVEVKPNIPGCSGGEIYGLSTDNYTILVTFRGHDKAKNLAAYRVITRMMLQWPNMDVHAPVEYVSYRWDNVGVTTVFTTRFFM